MQFPSHFHIIFKAGIGSGSNKRYKTDIYIGPIKAKELKYFRLILFVAVLAYVFFGLIYRIYLPGKIPMSMTQRYVVAGILEAIFASTYFSRWVKEHLEAVMYLAVSACFPTYCTSRT